MDALIGRLAASVGVDGNAAETTVGVTREFRSDIRETVGDDVLGEIASAIVGFALFV